MSKLFKKPSQIILALFKNLLKKPLRLLPGILIRLFVIYQRHVKAFAEVGCVGVGEAVFHAGVVDKFVIRADGFHILLEGIDLFFGDKGIVGTVKDHDFGFNRRGDGLGIGTDPQRTVVTDYARQFGLTFAMCNTMPPPKQ